MVDISKITKPKMGDEVVYKFGNKDTGEHERDFYDAYLGLYKAAEVLAREGLYHDAFLNLNFAIECFFKYVFCIVRAELLISSPLDTFEKSMSPFFKRVFTKKNDNLKAESFGHNLTFLLTHLKDTTTLKGKFDFEMFAKELSNEHSNWVASRYKFRANASMKKSYDRRNAAFQKLLSNSLVRLK